MKITQANEQERTILFESQTEREQFDVMMQAFAIFWDRSQRYGDSWRNYGALGAAFFLKDRANRVWVALRDKHTMNEEDCIDLINIACFCVRSFREENYGGEFWD